MPAQPLYLKASPRRSVHNYILQPTYILEALFSLSIKQGAKSSRDFLVIWKALDFIFSGNSYCLWDFLAQCGLKFAHEPGHCDLGKLVCKIHPPSSLWSVPLSLSCSSLCKCLGSNILGQVLPPPASLFRLDSVDFPQILRLGRLPRALLDEFGLLRTQNRRRLLSLGVEPDCPAASVLVSFVDSLILSASIFLSL